jgi:hypothetical protein
MTRRASASASDCQTSPGDALAWDFLILNTATVTTRPIDPAGTPFSADVTSTDIVVFTSAEFGLTIDKRIFGAPGTELAPGPALRIDEEIS